LFGPGDLDQTTLLVLANAVYFHAAWQTPFDPDQSQTGTFHTSSGVTQATFMQGNVTTTVDTPSYQAVRLAYTGGHFEALAIMPKAESLHDFVATLDPAGLSAIAAAADQRADLRLPRFTTQNYLQLDQTLSAMGYYCGRLAG
jgi:serpin B